MSWPIGLYRVTGESMYPTYRDGDILLGWRWFNPRPKQVVVASLDRMVVKRISKIDKGGVWLLGDNAEFSTDSRSYGGVGRSKLVAKVVFKLS